MTTAFCFGCGDVNIVVVGAASRSDVCGRLAVSRRCRAVVQGGSGGLGAGTRLVRQRQHRLDDGQQRRVGRRPFPVRGAAAAAAVVEVVAADERAVAATHRELVAGNESALTRDAPETVDVEDAVASSHHQVDLVEGEIAAGTLDAEQPDVSTQTHTHTHTHTTHTKTVTEAGLLISNHMASSVRDVGKLFH